MPASDKPSLKQVLFPVEERPIFQIAQTPRQADLFTQGTAAQFEQIPRFKAIVDAESGHVFAVVVDSYALVPNAIAIDLGKQCFATIFGADAADSMELFNVVMPRKRSFCHVDFVYRQGAVGPAPRDLWLPVRKYISLCTSSSVTNGSEQPAPGLAVVKPTNAASYRHVRNISRINWHARRLLHHSARR
ncbi:MAG: hypothetical protein H6643_08505 [Caldilineaceae bacterium]|nr:hypothetical protein [Caldilineaceae bacterium]